jgi:predicted HicB family RNase H-like nuclease
MPRKKPDTVSVSLRVPTELHRRLKSDAAMGDLSLESYMVSILKAWAMSTAQKTEPKK